MGRGGGRGTEIAVIADIARHRRNRESNTLPLINADQRGPRVGILVNPGDELCKPFRFLIEGWEEGVEIGDRAKNYGRRGKDNAERHKRSPVIIRINDPETCPIPVVCCAVHLSGGHGQEQVMDAAAFSWRIHSAVTRLLSQAGFTGHLIFNWPP